MQLLHEQKPLINNIGNMSVNLSTRNLSTHNIEIKEKRSSDSSLRLMNPVASGDNVATELTTPKLKEEMPLLVPCCEGKELQINQDLVRSGLSAISMKHESVMQCLSISQASERSQLFPGLVKHRNSFRSLHRPDLKRVPYLRRLSPDELEMLFRGYADLPSRDTLAKEYDETSKTTSTRGQDLRTIDLSKKTIQERSDNTLNSKSEARPAKEEIPVGMRLHGTRARLYTSVLAGTKAGDQLNNASTLEDYDTVVPEIVLPEDEVQLNEELQIILPPRSDDGAESVITTATDKTLC
ncbi:PREDICTED: uncharacterized protein LOC106099230 [Papilio polytes]|uniref:uncharacterized protein LOC106099230 n=1 Tax=Papilio polytes TaxID=76194 RepID=UPI0006760A0E|nr:PREDICTED: uncharacterized protein LOC106099230 [Papilio polytes]